MEMIKLRILLITLVIFIFTSDLNAQNSKPIVLQNDLCACLRLTDMELLSNMATSDDRDAFGKLLDSNRCCVLPKGTIIYILNKTNIYNKIRLKGGTITLWAFEPSTKQIKKKK